MMHIPGKLATVLALMATTVATPANACWLTSCFHKHETYLPVQPACAPACAPACSPCQQTCGYVPQTCYRTMYSSVPVTTLRPVAACDPCTGCPTTAYRPVTTFVMRPQLVPYTTYRPVATTSCSPCATTAYAAPLASPCGPGGCGTPYAPAAYAPAATYAAPAQPGCTNCTATPTYSTPSYSSPSYPASSTITAPGSPTTPSTGIPSLAPNQGIPANGSSLRTTIEDNGPRSQPVPNDSNRAVPSQPAPPRLFDPNDRITAKPINRNWSYQLVTYGAPDATAAEKPAAPAADFVDENGWSAKK